MRNVQKVAFCDRSFSFLHPAVWTYGAKKFVIQVTITSKGACFSSSQVLNWKHDSCREREREKKKQLENTFPLGFQKKNVLEISHSPRGVCFFLGREEKTLNLQKKRQHSICKKNIHDKVRHKCWEKLKKKRINLLLKAMIHHYKSEVRDCWTDGREYVSTSC